MKALALRLASRGGAVAGIVLVAALLTVAGLLWLGVSSRLIAVGARIDLLHHTRGNLLETRAEAMVAFARATDPRVLEHRAAALGLAPTVPDGALALSESPRGPAEVGGTLGVLRSRRLMIRNGDRHAPLSSPPLSRLAAAGVPAAPGE